MPAGWKVPHLAKTHYKTDVSAAYESAAPHPVNRSLILWYFSDSKRRFWSLWYSALTLGVLGTAFILSTTGWASNLMALSRRQASAVYRQLRSEDHSVIRIVTTTGLTAVVRNPNHQLAGDTPDGLRYLEIPEVSLSRHLTFSPQDIWTSKSITQWGLVIPGPVEGEYLISVHAKYSGTYRFSLTLTGADGVSQTTMNQDITLVSGQANKYILAFQKQPVTNSRLYR